MLVGGRHSTEVAFTLLTQPTRVLFSTFSKFYFRCCRDSSAALLRVREETHWVFKKVVLICDCRTAVITPMWQPERLKFFAARNYLVGDSDQEVSTPRFEPSTGWEALTLSLSVPCLALPRDILALSYCCSCFFEMSTWAQIYILSIGQIFF